MDEDGLGKDTGQFGACPKVDAVAMNRSLRSEEYIVGGEVVLFAKNIKNYCPHLPAKIGGLDHSSTHTQGPAYGL